MAVLTVDTSDNKKIIVGIDKNQKEIQIQDGIKFLKSEVCLPLIDKLCKENNVKITDINKVNVATGPGSYTGLRVGVAIANTLGYLLKVAVNNNKIGELVFPVYN